VGIRESAWRLRESQREHSRSLGLRGVLALYCYRFFGRPREITARIPRMQNPVHLRLGTSDARVYLEVLQDEAYAFDFPLSAKTIVDAGANIGMAAIYFTHRFPEARIVAIEPEASNFAALVRNVEPYPPITPLRAALWNRDGEISIGQPDPATGAEGKWAFVAHEGPGARVRAITMRTLMKEMEMPVIDLLKVDIEGAEKEVFEACDWMDNIRCLMIELHDRFKPGCSEAVTSAIHGFSQLKRGETTLFVREDLRPGPFSKE
jgi:FkbM family methyltransferase